MLSTWEDERISWKSYEKEHTQSKDTTTKTNRQQQIGCMQHKTTSITMRHGDWQILMFLSEITWIIINLF